ncbi:MAG: DMT family transporter [Desulfobacterales bacterium]|nr:DMT family transporter [Desulfobacterales bacterium]
MKKESRINFIVLLGCLSVFASAFCFYLATAVVKWSMLAGLTIAPSFFVFVRFFAGFLTVALIMLIKKQALKPKKYKYLVGRTLANCIAVYCFFKGTMLTSVAEANILNMTYPIFIAVISWFLLKDQRDIVSIIIVLVSFAGVWLIIDPGEMGFKTESLWGLTSGVSAAFALIYLNLCRKENDTETILFFLFGLGSVVIIVIFFQEIYIPDMLTTKYLLLCAVFSIAGQYLITIGFKYVTAIEGGIISSTRILLAAILGPFIVSDPALSLPGWIGALLIFSGNIYLTLRKSKTKLQEQ